MKYITQPNCNRCQTRCRGNERPQKCIKYQRPREGWTMAELALAYPTSLHEALSALPFDINLNFFLPRM